MADECKKIVRVIQGSQKTFTVNLRKDGDPLDLSTNEEIRVCVPSADGGAAQQLLKSAGEVSILNGPLGKIQITTPASKSDLMKIAEEQTIQVDVIETAGADPQNFQIEECFTVVAKVC